MTWTGRHQKAIRIIIENNMSCLLTYLHKNGDKNELDKYWGKYNKQYD